MPRDGHWGGKAWDLESEVHITTCLLYHMNESPHPLRSKMGKHTLPPRGGMGSRWDSEEKPSLETVVIRTRARLHLRMSVGGPRSRRRTTGFTQKRHAGKAGSVSPWVFIGLPLRTERWPNYRANTHANVTPNTSPGCWSLWRSSLHGNQLGGRPSGRHARISFHRLSEPRLQRPISGPGSELWGGWRGKTQALDHFIPS